MVMAMRQGSKQPANDDATNGTGQDAGQDRSHSGPAPATHRGTTPPVSEGSNNITQPRNSIIDAFNAGETTFNLPSSDKLTGQLWTANFHCLALRQDEVDIVDLQLDRAQFTFVNMIILKKKLGYSGRDFLFYKKRCGRAEAELQPVDLDQPLDFDHQIEAMLSENATERKIRFLLTKDQPREMEVAITPLKRPRKRPNSDEPTSSLVDIDAYKKWLMVLQREDPETALQDDYRDETIETYKEWLRHQGDFAEIMPYLNQQGTQDVQVHDEEANHGSSETPPCWPSHARRQRKNPDGSGGKLKKGGRGTLKGIAAATKRMKTGDHKLKIDFLSRLGGPTGENRRYFVDEVVLFTKKRAPLIGVNKWKDIAPNVKNSIASDVMQRWEIPRTVVEKEKIWKIAKERYKGWRSALSSTYRAYNTYAERMNNKPADVDIFEWHYLQLYFGSEKFQKISRKNTENRYKQKTRHRMGSKPFSQISYEERDPETGEEPDDKSLWLRTHMKDGQWSDNASKDVYDNTCNMIVGQENQSEPLTKEDENICFQKSYKQTIGCKTTRPHGHGYMSTIPTQSQVMDSRFIEQARATAATSQKNIELQGEVESLKQAAVERERIFVEKMQQFQEEEEKKRAKLQEEEEKKREALKQELDKQIMTKVLAALAQQREGTIQQINPESSIQADSSAAMPEIANNVRMTRLNKKGAASQKNNAPVSYISTQNLTRNVAAKRVRGKERTGVR